MGHAASVVYKQKVDSHDLTKETEKKPIIFNRNINQFTEEQQQVVSDGLVDFFHIFGYCSEGDSAINPSEEWMQ